MVTCLASSDDASGRILPSLSEPTLVEEAHHRIANSLQLLSAAISIEARALEDAAGIAALEMTKRRVLAIAGVHRLLFRSRSCGLVNLASYLERLGEELQEAGTDPASQRCIHVDTLPVATGTEDAIMIGMIVSELVANACKHAYRPGEAGDIWIELRPTPANGYRLEVEDHGRGLESQASDRGLGSGLISAIAMRLGAKWEYQAASPGTRFTLIIDRG